MTYTDPETRQIAVRDEHDRLRAEYTSIHDKAAAAARDLSHRERTRVATINRRLAELEDQFHALREQELGVKLTRTQDLNPAIFGTGMDWDSFGSSDASPGLMLGPQDSLVDWTRRRDGGDDLRLDDGRPAGIGPLIRGIAAGNWDGARQVQAQLYETGGNSNAGVLVPTPIAAEVLDLVRAKARTLAAGVQTIPMDSATLTLPRLVQGADPSWRAEGSGAVTPADLRFDGITLTAFTLPVLVRLSVELAEDISVEASGAINREIASAIASEVDRVVLYGTGFGEPSGIVAGIAGGDVGLAGAISDYDDLIDVVGGIRALNFEPDGVIYGSGLAATLAKLKGQDQYLTRPGYLQEVVPWESNIVEGTDAFVGEWGQAVLGLRTAMRLRVLDERYADEMEVGVLAYTRVAPALLHDEAFTVASDTIT